MFEARLTDPVHGTTTARADTAKDAVEAAFREMAKSWMSQADHDAWPKDGNMFDGEITNAK